MNEPDDVKSNIDESSIARFWFEIDGKKVFDDFSYCDELGRNSGQDTIEHWRPIQEFRGLYLCSNLARIKHKTTQKLCDLGNHEEHTIVYFIIAGKTMPRYLCNIVANTWVDNPNGYKKVYHKDGNNENNNPDNLQWML